MMRVEGSEAYSPTVVTRHGHALPPTSVLPRRPLDPIRYAAGYAFPPLPEVRQAEITRAVVKSTAVLATPLR